jgi:hypothetical protein
MVLVKKEGERQVRLHLGDTRKEQIQGRVREFHQTTHTGQNDTRDKNRPQAATYDNPANRVYKKGCPCKHQTKEVR